MTIILETDFDSNAKRNNDRRFLYHRLGVTELNLLIAMYEAQVENRPEALAKIIELRAQVKAAFPKPE